jgi:hypothetical protein
MEEDQPGPSRRDVEKKNELSADEMASKIQQAYESSGSKVDNAWTARLQELNEESNKKILELERSVVILKEKLRVAESALAERE